VIFRGRSLALGAGGRRREITDHVTSPMRDEMKDLLSRTVASGAGTRRPEGERSVFQESYKGHEKLYSQDSIKYVNGVIKQKGLTDDDRRAAAFFRNSLLARIRRSGHAHFVDEADNAERARP